MTANDLLDSLVKATLKATENLLLPVKPDEDYGPVEPCTFKCYKMRLPNSKSAGRYAPYVLHQILTTKDSQAPGNRLESFATVQSIFVVYDADEQQGALNLLNAMDRFRIFILKRQVLDKVFQLNIETGLECMVYPDDTAPYYMGQINAEWCIPRVEREVMYERYDRELRFDG